MATTTKYESKMVYVSVQPGDKWQVNVEGACQLNGEEGWRPWAMEHVYIGDNPDWSQRAQAYIVFFTREMRDV